MSWFFSSANPTSTSSVPENTAQQAPPSDSSMENVEDPDMKTILEMYGTAAKAASKKENTDDIIKVLGPIASRLAMEKKEAQLTKLIDSMTEMQAFLVNLPNKIAQTEKQIKELFLQVQQLRSKSDAFQGDCASFLLNNSHSIQEHLINFRNDAASKAKMGDIWLVRRQACTKFELSALCSVETINDSKIMATVQLKNSDLKESVQLNGLWNSVWYALPNDPVFIQLYRYYCDAHCCYENDQ